MVKLILVNLFLVYSLIFTVHADDQHAKNASLQEIEHELLQYISEYGASGYFKGQFAKIQEKWKQKAILPLLEIFSNSQYQYKHENAEKSAKITFKIKIMAGEALADLNDVYNDDLREKVKKTLDNMKRRPLDGYVQTLVTKILYQLGYRDDFERRLLRLQKRLSLSPKDYDTLSHIAMMYLNVGDAQKSIEYFHKAISVAQDNYFTYYNLACAYCKLHKTDEAIVALEKAVNYGYQDVDWILKDSDLSNLRDNPRFQELVKKLQNNTTKRD